MKIYLVSFLFVFITWGAIANNGTADKVNGKEVYVLSVPTVQYEVLGAVVINVDTERSLNEVVELLVAKAIKKEGKVGTIDAVIIRDARSAMCVRFKEKTNGQVCSAQSSSEGVYLYSTPEKEYTVVTAGPLNSFPNTAINERNNIAQVANNMKNEKTGKKADAVVIRNNTVQWIKYK